MKINLTTKVLFCFRKKLLKIIMRTFIFLFGFTVFGFAPSDILSQNAKITIDADKIITVDEVFKIIKEQTDYRFIYQSNLFENFPKVKLKKGTIKASTLLEKSLATGDFIYRFSNDKTIQLEKKEYVNTNSNAVLQEQISGTVTTEDGLPLTGATVYVTNNDPENRSDETNFPIRGTQTDFDGNFTLEVALNQYLVVGFIGYERFSQLITSTTDTYNIVLKESQNKLDEIVIVGYGETKRDDLTGSVASIKAKELAVQPTSQSFDQILGGQLSGVFVAQNSGRPGEGAIVNIRGATSLNGQNQPLYVVDGIPILVDEAVPNDFAASAGFGTDTFFQTNPLLGISPSDIASVDVLKDASAAAIYGSRAANGVILITTKKGRKNSKGQLNVKYSYSLQDVSKDFDWMNAQQFKDYITQVAQQTKMKLAGDNVPEGGRGHFAPNQVLQNNRQFGHPEGAVTPYFGTGDTDWADVLTRSAASETLSMNYSGGTENSTYYVSFNYTDQEGIRIKNDFDNYAIRLNVDSQVANRIKVGTNLSYNRNTNTFGGSSSLTTSELSAFQPTYDVYNPDGTYTSYIEYRGSPSNGGDPEFNPLAQSENSSESGGTNFSGVAFAEVDIIEGLKFKSTYTVGVLDSEGRNYRPIFLAFSFDDLRLSSSKTINTNWTHTLNYNKAFNEKHNLNVLFGSSFEQREISQTAFSVESFSNDALNNIGAAEVVTYRYEDLQVGRLNSHFGRLNYNYDDRYHLTFTGRADGSTKFGPGNQWGFFPSGAVMWKISNESFLEYNDFISDLRLRASLGKTGNANLPEFQFASAYLIPSNFRGSIRYNGSTAISSNGIPNANLQWESSDQFDMALEFALLNNQFTGSVNYYKNKTNDLLLNSTISPTTGFTNQTANIASVSNKGWEIELGADLDLGNVRWNSRFNIATNKNVLEKLNGGSIFEFGNPDNVIEGTELGAIFGYTVDGLFQNQQEIDNLNASAPSGEYQDRFGMEVGNYRLVDRNGDGEITRDDRHVLGSTQPDFFGGWNNTFSYKGFHLTANFQFVSGAERSWADLATLFQSSGLDRNSVVGVLDDTWSPFNTDEQNANATYEQLLLGGTSRRFARERLGPDGGEFSTSVFDTSYLRFKTLQLGYSMPVEIVEKIFLRSLQFNVTVNNLWTSTDWPGLDPEAAGGNTNARNSVTSSVQNEGQLTKTVTFGINIGI